MLLSTLRYLIVAYLWSMTLGLAYVTAILILSAFLEDLRPDGPLVWLVPAVGMALASWTFREADREQPECFDEQLA